MARKKGPYAAGERTKIVRRLPTECGSELKGARVRVVEVYESKAKGGEEHAIVQLEETNAVVGVPTSALQGARRRRSVSIGPAAWEKLFGKKRREN